MDNNVIETRSTPQTKEQISSDWDYPEKGQDLPINQIDPIERFLSLEKGKSGSSEYRFDVEGQIQASKEVKIADNNSSVSIYTPAEIDSGIDLEANGDSLYIMFTHLFGEDRLGLAHIKYSGGKLNWVYLSNVFRAKEDESIGTHLVALEKKVDASGTNPGDWDLILKKGDIKKIVQAGNSNKAGTVGDSEDLSAKVSWEIREGEMIITQEQDETGALKIITTPLELDMDQLKKVLFSKAPYQKEKVPLAKGVERLMIPWMRIGELIGSRVSYSIKREA